MMDSDSDSPGDDGNDPQTHLNRNVSNKTVNNGDEGQGSYDVTADQSLYLCEQRVASPSNPVCPIGGSVSTNTTHTSKHVDASGNQALQLVEAIMNKSKTESYDMTVDSRYSSKNDVQEVHVHLTQTNVHNPSAIALGGPVVVNPPGEGITGKSNETPRPPTQKQKLRSETERTIEKWTEGMVETRATQVVLDKISRGRTWITITGSPGEGKTTVGYLVLKHLHSMGRQVYDIKTPRDYFKVKESKQPVLMFNDILGSSHFDLDKRWKEVLSDILAIQEHKSDGDSEVDDANKTQHQPVVVIVSRSNVLKEASPHLGRFKDFVLSEKGTVDLTHGNITSPQERMKIWTYHSQKYNVIIDSKTVKDVCQMSPPYGFPHCCRLFASMYSKNRHLCMKYFFSKPLEFLNQTSESLMIDPITGVLLREMLRTDGSLDLDSVTDDERRFQWASVVETLRGSYLSQDFGTVTFHHSSVYDSAAFVVCKKDPLFVIKNCSLTFLNEWVRISGIEHGPGIHQKGQNTVTLSNRYAEPFLLRLKTETENGNISLSLQQQALHDEQFASRFMQSLVSSKSEQTELLPDQVRMIIRTLDKRSKESFLFLSTKSTSDKILKFICDSIILTEEEVADASFGSIEHVSVESLKLLDMRYEIDLTAVNNRFQTPLLLAATKGSEKLIELLLQEYVDIFEVDRKNNTALHVMCRHGVDGDGSVVKMLIERDADVNVESNEYPWLPLNIACHYGHKNIVESLLECGADINKTTRGGSTPLHNASWMGHADIVTFLLDRGADIDKSNSHVNEGKTPLHDACLKGHLDVVTVLLDRGADANKLSYVGENTHLHYACLTGHVDVVKFLLDKGANVNQCNSAGRSPLHYACCNGSLDVVTVLLDRGADVTKVCHHDGDTPLHTACWMGHEDVVGLLLEKGAETNKSNGSIYNEKTPLHDACHQGHLGVVTILLDHGADLNKVDSDGNTPLYWATVRKQQDVIAVLIERGATTKKADSGAGEE